MRPPFFLIIAAFATMLFAPYHLTAQTNPDEPLQQSSRERRSEVRMPTPAFRTEVPPHQVDLILGRPTKNSITLSVLVYEDMEGYVASGTQPGQYQSETPKQRFAKGEPVELLLTQLEPNTRYYYRFRSRVAANEAFTTQVEGVFMTARPPGSTFTFTVQADPHLDYGIDPEIYKKSLTNAITSNTDFHIDLGDTFMTDKYTDFKLAAPQYLAQRYYFSIVGSQAPVFLVLGNHDGEQTSRGENGPNSMAVWSNTMRKRYFPNPIPNEFYTGNTTPDTHAGLLENYFAWEWGDALFVALDPFWFSARPRRGSGDNWSRTLGVEQYRWLTRTLEASKAKFKFVFIHHLVGGETPEGRGGSEASHFFEWGGKDLDGMNTFAQKRSGWPQAIHDLLVKHGVNIVFHGHDHLYAQQERDGIIYQLVPQPGHTRFDNTRSAAEYGYKSGVIAGASGILSVTVTPLQAAVEYVRAYPTSAENREHKTGGVTHQYKVGVYPSQKKKNP